MRRREFITLLGGAVTAYPHVARAQQSQRGWRIGQVRSGAPELNIRSATAFEQRLTELGYIHGSNVDVLNRFVPPHPQAMEDAIQELMPQIDLLVVWGTMGGLAARKLVRTLPVIFVAVAAPLEMGLRQVLPVPAGT
jgi:putative ABC transport system substrate-binding protein